MNTLASPTPQPRPTVPAAAASPLPSASSWPGEARLHCRFCRGWSALASASSGVSGGSPPFSPFSPFSPLPPLPPLAPSRRLFGRMLLAGGAAAAAMPGTGRAQGVAQDVGKTSAFTKLVSADQVEQAAARQYAQMLAEARSKRALGPDGHPQVKRLRAIAERIIPFAQPWNARAARWRWEVNLLGSPQLNAFCMPGGKIAFYTGILQQLQLDDEEVACIMGHEAAHALREHARERMGKSSATSIGLSIGAQLLGLGSLGDAAANLGTQLLTLKFSRDDETEADLVGMELAARAGYDPEAGVRLWQKMQQASKGAPPQWMSTHPSSSSRINEIRDKLPKVLPLYAQADKPRERFEPMAAARTATP